MKELVIASGKGGTGKTSLTGSFAALAGRSVLVDCDVDAANLYLIVSHCELDRHDFTTSRRARIIDGRCTQCGLCYPACRFGAVELVRDAESAFGERFRIEPLACEGCGLCVRICPDEAIAFEPVVSGEWFLSESDFGPFLHARLGIAESNSGRLVSLLRQEARDVAGTTGDDLIIIDGPPGIGCPVIASISGADYLLIVTEPSVTALHDMERLVETAEHFGVPIGVCINKYDISLEMTEKIEELARERHLVVHGKIPFDPAFTRAQVAGKTYMEAASGEGSRAVRQIWGRVRAVLNLDTAEDRERFAV